MLKTDLQSGDVLLFDRKCLKMKDPVSVFLCCCAKVSSPYDHVGFVHRRGPNNIPFVVEANRGGVTSRPLSDRLRSASINRICVRRMGFQEGRTSREDIDKHVAQFVEGAKNFPYRTSIFSFLTSIIDSPDKLSRMRAASLMYEIEAERKQLKRTVDSIGEAQLSDQVRSALVELIKECDAMYIALSEDHFEHIGREQTVSSLQSAHYLVDTTGRPQSEGGVSCSELAALCLQNAKLLQPFPFAEVYRPTDFVSSSERLFLYPGCRLGPEEELIDNGRNHKLGKTSIEESEMISDCATTQLTWLLGKHTNSVRKLREQRNAIVPLTSFECVNTKIAILCLQLGVTSCLSWILVGFVANTTAGRRVAFQSFLGGSLHAALCVSSDVFGISWKSATKKMDFGVFDTSHPYFQTCIAGGCLGMLSSVAVDTICGRSMPLRERTGQAFKRIALLTPYSPFAWPMYYHLLVPWAGRNHVDSGYLMPWVGVSMCIGVAHEAILRCSSVSRPPLLHSFFAGLVQLALLNVIPSAN